MKLQYRLFLWISLLFSLAGLVTFVLVGYASNKQLKKAQANLKTEILQLNEAKREYIEQFLASDISESLAPIDVLLDRLATYFLQSQNFVPGNMGSKKGSWLDAAELLDHNKWLGFIQNTSEGTLKSLIIPREATLDSTYRVNINEDLAWIVTADQFHSKEPYLGVRVPMQSTLSQRETEMVGKEQPLPTVYCFYHWKDLLQPSSESLQAPLFKQEDLPHRTLLTVPWSDGYQISIDQFSQVFDCARAYLEQALVQGSGSGQDRQIKEWIAAQLDAQGGDLSQVHLAPLDHSFFVSSSLIQRFPYLGLQYDQIYMIWAMSALFNTGLFGDDFFASPSPCGIAVFPSDQAEGEGLRTTDVFFPQPVFQDADFFKGHSNPSMHIGDGIAVFSVPALNHVYIGNTAQMKIEAKAGGETGYLTLGIDGDTILKKLVLATHQTAMLIHQDKVFGAFSEKGVAFNASEESALPIASLISEKSGEIAWGKENFFFLHMMPYPDVDLHFIVLNPIEKEFALLSDLDQGAQDIIHSVLFDFHVIGFSLLVLAIILLHNVARRITDPISQLAAATADIVKGRYEEVEIPRLSESRSDEVFTLCHSFEQMVKGLQEKEKVKGILNKVVSQEIAQEILEGHVHLGGEEKKVTVLFADIRDFTQMTRSMPPKQVIELLNGCMTKISFIVDRFSGVIDKYVGDEAMALFGAPVEDPSSALNAVKSAIAMIDALREWNQQRQRAGQPSVEMGIGIHTGQVLAGNMGAEDRLNYTVIGSHVNLASRLCSAAGRMEIFISKATLDEPGVKEAIEVEETEPIVFKGFDQPIVVYRVKGL